MFVDFYSAQICTAARLVAVKVLLFWFF